MIVNLAVVTITQFGKIVQSWRAQGALFIIFYALTCGSHFSFLALDFLGYNERSWTFVFIILPSGLPFDK